MSDRRISNSVIEEIKSVRASFVKCSSLFNSLVFWRGFPEKLNYTHILKFIKESSTHGLHNHFCVLPAASVKAILKTHQKTVSIFYYREPPDVSLHKLFHLNAHLPYTPFHCLPFC